MISKAHILKKSRGEGWNDAECSDYRSLLPNSAEAWGAVTTFSLVDPGQSPDCGCGG